MTATEGRGHNAGGLSRVVVSLGRVALSIVLSTALLELTARQVDGVVLGRLLRGANYGYLFCAVVVYFVDLALRSVRWQVILRSVAKLSPWRLFLILAVCYMANNLLPGRIGELGRAYLVDRREHIDGSAVLASVALERVIDGITVLGLFFTALALLPAATLPPNGWITTLARLAAATVGLAALFCASAVLARTMWFDLAEHLQRRLPRGLRERAVVLLDRSFVGFGVLHEPRLVIETAVLSVAIWVVGALTYILVAEAFGVRLPLLAAIAAICVVNLATAVPQAPAGLGAFEAAAKASFVLFGVGSTTALGITVALHAVLVFPVVAVGLVILWRTDLSVASLWTRSRATSPQAVLEPRL